MPVRTHMRTNRDLATSREATLKEIWANPPKLTQEQLELFIAHHEGFLARKPKARRLIMRFVQLHTLSMVGRNLSEAELTGACLYACDLQGANFRVANLYCADLRCADASGADFTRADLRGSTFSGAKLNGAKLDQADLRAAVIGVATEVQGIVMLRHRRSKIRNNSGPAIGSDGETVQFSVDFTDASLTGARLESASLKNANFTGANLTGAKLAGAKLEGARLHGAILAGVDVKNLGLTQDQTAGAVFDPTDEAKSRSKHMLQRLIDAEAWWNTGGKDGGPAILDGEDLRVINGLVAGKLLTGVSARNCIAIGLNFAGAMLQGAAFDGSDLRGANFENADLRGASFKGANLTHARFNGADTTALRVSDSKVKPVDFTDSKGGPWG